MEYFKDYIRNRLIGKRFGQLTVINFDSTDSKHRSKWLCQCDCGNKKILRNDVLVQGTTKSCGCLNKAIGNKHHSWRGYEDISYSKFQQIKRDAKKRNLKFDITIEQIWRLYLQQNKKCAISNVDIKFSTSRLKYDGNASLDRIDSNKGYTLENVQWIHKDINFMKQDFTMQEFLEWNKKIYQFNKLY